MIFGFIVILVLMIPLAAVILDSELGRALARRLDHRKGIGSEEEEMDKRLASLEAEVERLGRELSRLEEGNDFLHRLLEGKTSSGRELPAGEESD